MSWISVKERLPKPHEFVEVVLRDFSYSSLRRSFMSLFKHENGLMWTSASMTEEEWSTKGYKVTHWKPMEADPKGRKAYLSITKRGLFKIVFKKEKV